MRIGFLALACAAAIGLRPDAAIADGVMVPRDRAWRVLRERALINEPEQKAVVFWRAGREDLIISPSYAGAADQFAWLVPVPARPRVEILKGALFHELAELTTPEPPVERMAAGTMKSATPLGGVTLIERETVGAYDVSVLAADDSDALMQWLGSNGYVLPPAAERPASEYVREGWTFVACRVKAPEAAAAGLRSGTLAPLRLGFACRRPIYPMRLSSANPEPFTVLVYLVLLGDETNGRPGGVDLVSAPDADRTPDTRWAASADANQIRYPTLASLTTREANVFVERARVDPADCTRDYEWTPPRLSRIPLAAAIAGGVLAAGLLTAWFGRRMRVGMRIAPIGRHVG